MQKTATKCYGVRINADSQAVPCNVTPNYRITVYQEHDAEQSEHPLVAYETYACPAHLLFEVEYGVRYHGDVKVAMQK